jgi:hypothetical protein
VRVIAEELNMNRGNSATDWEGRYGNEKNFEKMLPRILTHDQKQRRLHISSDLLRNAEMFDRVITGDEMTDLAVENTEFTSVEESTHVSVAGQDQSCFFDHKWIFHYEFIAEGQTVNQQCYLEVLTRLRECVRRKRPGIWPDK